MYLLLASTLLSAGFATASGAPLPIIGGDETNVCGWPTSVYLGECSGTLVHPELVLYAAHCGTSIDEVIFGEDASDGTAVATTDCDIHPNFDGVDSGSDLAYCRLAEPMELPISPIIMGCELDMLAAGVSLFTTGWGITPMGPSGTKHVVELPIVDLSLPMSVIIAGGGDVSTCDGDSGGGSFVQLDDGSWRLVAVSSAVLGSPCSDGESVLAIATNAVSWIEGSTGLDITPCFDAEGNWSPGDGCQQLPLDPATGGGAWPACEFGALSGFGSSCGPAAGGDDRTPPTIVITAPRDGAEIALVDGMGSFTVTIEVDDEDSGVAMTRLRIDGDDVPDSEDDAAPFEIPQVTLPEGTYTLEAIAIDNSGNQGVSAAIEVSVGDPPAPSDTSSGEQDTTGTPATSGGPTGDPGDSGSATNLDDSAGVDAASAGEDSSSAGASGEPTSGCGCAQRTPRSEPLWLMGLLGLARRRRPR